jgi:ribonuclease HI
MLIPPREGKPLKLYISATQESIGNLLAQDNENGHEQAVFYLSRILNPTECRYSTVEKLCLALYFSAFKLRHYMLAYIVFVIAQTDVIKCMLSKPILSGRMCKWSLTLVEFHLLYVPQKAIKGQALADFLADHPCEDVPNEAQYVALVPWKFYFDGSRAEQGAGVGIILESPQGVKTQLAFRVEKVCSNNHVEYEALVLGLEILLQMGIKNVTIFGDSQLVINQVKRQYKCESVLLAPYLVSAQQLLQEFQECTLLHIHREENHEANRMAQVALGYRPIEDEKVKIEALKVRTLPLIFTRQLGTEIFTLEVGKEDWRSPIISYLRSPSGCTNNALKLKVRRYVLMEEDERLFKCGADEILLKCISTEEAIQVMAEVHEGICGVISHEI